MQPVPAAVMAKTPTPTGSSMAGPQGTVATARVRIRLAHAAEAQRVADAIEPDNDGYLACEVDGANLVLRAEASTAMGLLRTVDDAIGCVRATGID